MSLIKINDSVIGKGFVKIAGPCAIESKKQLFKTVEGIYKKTDIIRGGAFKPRTSPDSFQGLGEKGLKLLKKAGRKYDLPTITEVMVVRDVKLVSKYADILQVGARNMQNYPLLKILAKTDKPVMLKRGFGNTVKEWLSASKYILEGNDQLIFCERGIRTFEDSTRFTLDLAGALEAKQASGQPVIIDPSHGTGGPNLIPAMARASKAAGFDGVMVEVHHQPNEALCDAEQALTPDQYLRMFDK